MLQARNAVNKAIQMYVCRTSPLGVVAPEVHQNDHSYVCAFSGLIFDSLCKNLAWWVVSLKTSKTTTLSKLGVGAWAGMSTCTGQYGIVVYF